MSASPTIPATWSPARASWCGAAPARRRPIQETVLLIDDSVTFREELKAALEDAGYGVIVAGTGEDGLRLAADQRPTAIIVDGVLPGIDGATVIRRIRLDAALRQLPCLLLTASEDRGAEVRALDAGADAFVRKDEDIAGDPRPAQRHAAQRRRAGRRPRHGEPARAEEDSRRRRQRNLSPEPRRGLARRWLRGRARPLRRGSAGAARGPAGRLHPARPADAGHRRPRDLPAHQERAGHARHPDHDADRGRRSRCDDRGPRAPAPTTTSPNRATSTSCARACWRRSGASSSRTRTGASANSSCAPNWRRSKRAPRAKRPKRVPRWSSELRSEERGARILQLFGGARSARAAAQHRRLRPGAAGRLRRQARRRRQAISQLCPRIGAADGAAHRRPAGAVARHPRRIRARAGRRQRHRARASAPGCSVRRPTVASSSSSPTDSAPKAMPGWSRSRSKTCSAMPGNSPATAIRRASRSASPT